MQNHLFYGDNLDVLRKHVQSDSVDLVYLDPPFNSNRDYNVLFREQSGEPSMGQIKAFDDTWDWSEHAYDEFVTTCPVSNLVELMQGFVNTLGRNPVTAYLVMMAPRIVELHRVLKPTGSLYLHCDPTASHYLKLILDARFDVRNFRNEIVWQRTSAHSDSRQGAQHFGRMHDVILCYTKTNKPKWNALHREHDQDYIKSHYPYTEEGTGRRFGLWDITGPGGAAKGNPSYEIFGVTKYWRYSEVKMRQKIADGRVIQSRPGAVPREKRYLDESQGVQIGDVWTDIPPLNSQAKERLGYPTQKPAALLERIIQTATDEGDVVLDPFCGCGTAVVAAQGLRRNWVGIDITHLAVALIRYRVSDMFGLVEKQDYQVHGEPTTEAEARALATNDPLRKEFEKWAVSLVPRARPANEGKKGADGGIDGLLYFKDDLTAPKKVLIQVKSGKVGSPQINQLRGTVEREKATLGLFITLEPPTSVMVKDAESFGFYTSGGVKIPRLQIRTVTQLLKGEGFAMPYAATVYGVQSAGVGQGALDF